VSKKRKKTTAEDVHDALTGRYPDGAPARAAEDLLQERADVLDGLLPEERTAGRPSRELSPREEMEIFGQAVQAAERLQPKSIAKDSAAARATPEERAVGAMEVQRAMERPRAHYPTPQESEAIREILLNPSEFAEGHSSIAIQAVAHRRTGTKTFGGGIVNDLIEEWIARGGKIGTRENEDAFLTFVEDILAERSRIVRERQTAETARIRAEMRKPAPTRGPSRAAVERSTFLKEQRKAKLEERKAETGLTKAKTILTKTQEKVVARKLTPEFLAEEAKRLKLEDANLKARTDLTKEQKRETVARIEANKEDRKRLEKQLATRAKLDAEKLKNLMADTNKKYSEVASNKATSTAALYETADKLVESARYLITSLRATTGVDKKLEASRKREARKALDVLRREYGVSSDDALLQHDTYVSRMTESLAVGLVRGFKAQWKRIRGRLAMTDDQRRMEIVKFLDSAYAKMGEEYEEDDMKRTYAAMVTILEDEGFLRAARPKPKSKSTAKKGKSS